MNEIQRLLLSVIAGGVIGVFFFGSLWWTIRRGLESRYAVMWFTGGFLVRMSVTLLAMYATGHDNWRQMLACLCGFGFARIVAVRLTGTNCRTSGPTSAEVHHAS